MNRLQLITGFFIINLVIISCGIFPQSESQLEDVNQIGTIVSQTVEAKSLPASNQEPIPTDTIIAATPALEPTRSDASTLKVAYSDGSRNLWLWSEGGNSIPLDQSGEVTFSKISPDGSMVMFLRSQDYINYSLWVVNTNGSGSRELVSQTEFNEILADPSIIGLSPADVEFASAVAPYQMDWIPGEKNIAYNTSPKYEGPGLMILNDLWKVNSQTGERTLLLNSGEGGNFYYSPDGQQIALVTYEDISLVKADISDRRDGVLKFKPVITYSEYQYYPTPLWSPDSSYLLVDVPPEDPMKQPPQPTSIYRIPEDGSQANLLTSIDTFFLEEINFSPDTLKMAYLTQEGPAENNQQSLHIANIDGSADNIVETGNLRFAGWSPDSSHFIMTMPDGGNPRIGQTGHSSQPILDISSAQNFQWIEADRFLFLGKNNQNWQLRLGSLDGTSEIIADFGPISDVFGLDASFSMAE
jgi:hypothetical protein